MKKPLWIKIYDLMESKSDESKYINPVLKDNPYYRSGVNDGLRVVLGKLNKPKIAFIGEPPPVRSGKKGKL